MAFQAFQVSLSGPLLRAFRRHGLVRFWGLSGVTVWSSFGGFGRSRSGSVLEAFRCHGVVGFLGPVLVAFRCHGLVRFWGAFRCQGLVCFWGFLVSRSGPLLGAFSGVERLTFLGLGLELEVSCLRK